MSSEKAVVLNPDEQIIVSWDESYKRQKNRKKGVYEGQKYETPSASKVLNTIDRNAEIF